MPISGKVTAGGCLCGAVRYEVRGTLRDVVNCHCKMCQRLHGNFGSHSKAAKTAITVISGDDLSWYQTSDIARRGFCRKCGSNLFWEPFDLDAAGIVAGTLDDPSGLKSIGQILVAEKADFVESTDDCPQFEGSSRGELAGDYK